MMSRKLITFDWAIKRLLRSKANFGILEGFLSELLKQNIRIEAVLESESNQDHDGQKYNRVDLKVKNSQDEIIIVEIQYDREHDYLHRIFYAVSKAALEPYDYTQIQEAGQTAGSRGLKGGSLLSVVKRCG